MAYNNVNKVNNQGRNNIKAAKTARQANIKSKFSNLMNEIAKSTNQGQLNRVKASNVRYRNASAANKNTINAALASRHANLVPKN